MELMRFKLAGLNRVVGVAGGRIKPAAPQARIQIVEEIGRQNNTIMQIFDADFIAGQLHLVHAARQAVVAIETGSAHAKSPGLELARWAAAEKQISAAVEKLGLKPTTTRVGVVAIGDTTRTVEKSLRLALTRLKIDPDPSVLQLTPKKRRLIKEAFGITDPELKVAPLEMLVLERIASLAL